MADLEAMLRRRADGRPRLMGVLNSTPDSFYAASRAVGIESGVQRGLDLWAAGADWVDVGGESTRPGAERVDSTEELQRVVPLIAALHKAEPDMLISIDTRRADVAAAALDAGAQMLNDVSGLRDPVLFDLVLERGCAVCIMHMLGEPQQMQSDPLYDDVVADVSTELVGTAQRLIAAGHPPQLILLDPGIGFGKTVEHNLELLRNSDRLRGSADLALLWGVSRKSIIGALTGKPDPDDRLAGTLGVAAVAQQAGIDMLRIHDVLEHHDLGRVLASLWNQETTPVVATPNKSSLSAAEEEASA